MMKSQMDHALTRLQEAYYNVLGERPKPDPDADKIGRAELMRTGKVKVTPALVKRAITAFEAEIRRDGGRWTHEISYHLMNELDDVLSKAYVAPADAKLAAWDKRAKKLREMYEEAKDEIILGDVERALAIIAEFRTASSKT